MAKMVRVTMRGSVFYGRPRQRYGPGQSIEVPEGLARSLGLTPLEDSSVQEKPTEIPHAPAIDPWERMGLSEDQRASLNAAGFDLDMLRAAEDKDILDLPHIGQATLKKIRAALEE